MTPRPAPWPPPRIGLALVYAILWGLPWVAVMTAAHAARVGPEWLVRGVGFGGFSCGLFVLFKRMQAPAEGPARSAGRVEP